MSDVGLVAIVAIAVCGLVIVLVVIFVAIFGKKGRKITED